MGYRIVGCYSKFIFAHLDNFKIILFGGLQFLNSPSLSVWSYL